MAKTITLQRRSFNDPFSNNNVETQNQTLSTGQRKSFVDPFDNNNDLSTINEPSQIEQTVDLAKEKQFPAIPLTKDQLLQSVKSVPMTVAESSSTSVNIPPLQETKPQIDGIDQLNKKIMNNQPLDQWDLALQKQILKPTELSQGKTKLTGQINAENSAEAFNLLNRMNTENLSPSQAEKSFRTPGENLVGSFGQGVTGTLGGIARAPEIVGVETFKPIADELNKASEYLTPKEMDYMQNVVSGLGSMAIFAPVGVASGVAAKGLSQLFKNPTAVKWIASGTAGALESMAEAGSVYDEALQSSNGDKNFASESAYKTFLANLVIIPLTNRYGIFGDQAEGLKKALLSAPVEGLQEGAQTFISDVSQGKDPNIEQILKDAGVGAIVGGAVGPLIGEGDTKQTPNTYRDLVNDKFVREELLNPKNAQMRVNDENLRQESPKVQEATNTEVVQPTEKGSAEANKNIDNENAVKSDVSSTQVNLSERDSKPILDFVNQIPENKLYKEGDEYGKETEPHVTALYGLTTKNIEDVKKVAEGFGDVKLTLGKTSLFENDKYDVLKVDVQSQDLHKLNKLLRDNLDYKSDFPDYKPHLTLAYLKKGEGKNFVGNNSFEGKEISLSQLMFSDQNYNKTPINLSTQPMEPTNVEEKTNEKRQEVLSTQPEDRIAGQTEGEQSPSVDKQPYEMTEKEFVEYGLNKQGGKQYTFDEIKNKLGQSHIDLESGMHKRKVQQALSEGKTVPPEVLADYPELQKKDEGSNKGGLKDYNKITVDEFIKYKDTRNTLNDAIKDLLNEKTDLNLNDGQVRNIIKNTDYNTSVPEGANLASLKVAIKKEVEQPSVETEKKPEQSPPVLENTQTYEKLLSDFFDLRDQRKNQKGFRDKQNFDKLREIGKQIQQSTGKPVLVDNLDNLYIDKQKVTKPVERAKPVNIDDVEITRPEAKQSFEQLPVEEADRQTFMAEMFSEKKYLPKRLQSLLPEGFGQKKIDKGVSDIKQDAGAEQSKEAQIVREFTKALDDELGNYGYFTLSSGQEVTREDLENELNQYIEERNKQYSDKGDTSFEFGENVKPKEAKLPKNLKITDAYGKTFLGYNMVELEKVAKEKGYNLYDALIKKVDTHDNNNDKIKGMQSIYNDLYSIEKTPPVEKTAAGDQYYFGGLSMKGDETSSSKKDIGEQGSPLFSQPKEADKNQQVLFQKADTEKDLIAVHNLTEENLLFANKMGGLAMPSIAITKAKQGFHKYGGISLIADKNMIDPATNYVYSRDAYSPTYPTVYSYINKKNLGKVISDIQNSMGKEVYARYSGDIYTLEEDINKGYYGIKALSHNDAVRFYYLKETNQLPEIPYKPEPLSELAYYEGIYEDVKKISEKYKYPEVTEEKIQAEISKMGESANNYYNTPEGKRSWAEEIVRDANSEETERINEKIADELLDRYDFVKYGENKELLQTIKDLKKERGYNPWRLSEDLAKIRNPKKVFDWYKFKYDLAEPIIKSQEAEYLDFVENKFKDVFGEEYILQGKKKVAHTLSNVIDIMGTTLKGSEKTLVQGLSKSAVKSAKEFKTLDDLRSYKDNIVTQEEFEINRDKLSEAFNKLSDKLAKYFPSKDFGFERLDNLSSAIGDIANSAKMQDSTISKVLRKNSYGAVPNYLYDDIRQVARMMREMSTVYFEAKKTGAIKIGEFNGALIPEGSDNKIIKALEENGITNIKFYKDAADRTIKLQEFEDVLFQEKNVGKPLSVLSEKQLKKEIDLVNKLLPNGFTVELDEDLSDGQNLVRGLFDINNKVFKINPTLADNTTIPHEIAHAGIYVVEPERASAILKAHGWDGKGNIADLNNESLRKAHEQIAEKFEKWYNENKRYNNILEGMFKKLKQLFKNLYNYVKGKVPSETERYYRDLSEGNLNGTYETGFAEPSFVMQKLKDITETENFKKWFGDSKVVDENGKPLVVYHGTNFNFDEFSEKEVGKQFGDFSIGFNFSNNPNIADSYGYSLIPSYIKAGNPLKIKAGEEGSTHAIDRDRYSLIQRIIESRKTKNPYDSIIAVDKDDNIQVVVFSPTQIKSAIGNKGTFDPNNPNILFQKQKPFNEFMETEVGEPKKKDGLQFREETIGEKLERLFVDKNNRAKKMTAGVTDDLDFYAKMELYVQKSADQYEKVLDYLTDEKDGFLKRLNNAGFSVNEFGQYLYAKHAQERNEAILNKNGKEHGSGLTDIEAGKILDLPKFKNSKIQEFEKEFRKEVIRKKLSILRNADVLTDDEVAQFDNYQYYVPLKGKAGKENRILGTKKFSVGSTGIMEAKGRTSIPENPFVQAVLDLRDAIIRAEKNKVNQTFLKFIEENPNENIYEVKGRRVIPSYNKHGEIDRFDKVDLAENEIAVYVKNKEGKRKQKVIIIHDDILKESMVGLGASANLKILRKLNDYMRTVVTIANPEFIITNFERDLQTALINIGGEKSKTLAKNVLKDVPRAMKAFYKGKDATGEYADYLKEYKASGAKVGWMDNRNIKELNDDFEKEIRKFNEKGYLKNAANKTIKFIENINQAIENGVRLSTYANLRKSGVTEQKAAQYAKDLTVNFERKGKYGELINSAYLFWNAGMQGTNRVYRALKSKNSQKVAGGLIGMSILMGFLNRLWDDDEYDKLSEWERDNHWIFMLGNGNHIKVKTPYGYNIFNVIGNVTGDALFGKTDFRRSAGRLGNSIIDAFNPFGSSGSWLQLVSPTFADPVAQLAENKSFFGSPIYKNQPEFGPNIPESELYFKSVNPILRQITTWLNEVSGGNKYRSGLIDVNPEVVEHVLEFIGGGAGKFTINTVRTSLSLFTEDETKVNAIPFVRTTFATKNELYDLGIIYGLREDIKRREFTSLEKTEFTNSLEKAHKNKEISDKAYKTYKKQFSEYQFSDIVRQAKELEDEFKSLDKIYKETRKQEDFKKAAAARMKWVKVRNSKEYREAFNKQRIMDRQK